jgi:hypothetical protein
MTQHFTRNTVEASAWCAICKKRTMHRVDADEMQGRLGPCLECIDRHDANRETAIAKAEYERQRELFS